MREVYGLQACIYDHPTMLQHGGVIFMLWANSGLFLQHLVLKNIANAIFRTLKDTSQVSFYPHLSAV